MESYNVTSPCINICKIDEATQRCLGCDRTIDEITRWSRMDNEAKLAVIDAIVLRKRSQPSSSQQNQSQQSLSQQTPIKPGKPSKSDNTTPGEPGNRSTGCE